MDPRMTILVILHQEHSTPGRIGKLLETLGFRLDIRRPRYGDPLPATMDGHVGAVIFGGPMSVNDEQDWIRREIDWIKVPLKQEKPFLGICLGAQMLARHLGHRVAPHPEGRVEAGYYAIDPTEDGHSLCECPFPDKVYQWHREGFELPNGGVLLARGEHFEAQAFSFGSCAYGLQFHPEVTYSIMCRWMQDAGDCGLNMLGAEPRHRHIQGWFRHDAAVTRWSNAFLRNWVAGKKPATAN
jgi:GMP synthase (glutamine-hydrolysing)